MNRISRVVLAVGMLTFIGLPALTSWTWHNPLPSGNTINAVSTSSSGLIGFAADAGQLLELDAGTFIFKSSPTLDRIHDIALSGDYGVMAGEHSTVLLRDGGEWIENKPLTTAWFYGAALLPDGQAYICGDLGKIYHFDGTDWIDMPTGTSTTLKDIDMLSPARGWAVGLYGTARVFNGTNWLYYSSSTTRFLRKVSGVTDSCAWAVGDLGTIVRWTGSGFQTETSPTTQTLYGVVAISTDEAWAVGDAGTVIHRLSGVWSVVSVPEIPATVSLRGVAEEDNGDIIIAGVNGFIIRFDGSTWERLDEDLSNGIDFYDVEIAPDGDILLAGTRGKLFEYSGGDFLPIDMSTTNDLYKVYRDPYDTMWVTGKGGVIRKNTGSGWITQNTSNPDNVYDIYALSPTNVWTAGGYSDGSCVGWTVLHYTGSQWVVYTEGGS